MEVGRPTKYSAKLVSELCERIAEGQSVRQICSDPEMPAMATFFRWLHEKSEFKEQYAIAKEAGAEALFADILSIADDGTNDWMEKQDKEGNVYGWAVNGEALGRSRLRVDARKWYLSKVLPKVYGDKQQLEHSTDPERPFEVSKITTEELKARLAQYVDDN